MVVLLRIRKDREETWQGGGRAQAKQAWGRHPIGATGTGEEDGDQHPQRIAPSRALAPLDFLAAVIPACGASRLGGLHRLTLDAHRTGGGCTPRGLAAPLAQGRDSLGPGSVIAPLGKGVIDGAVGQHIVGQHRPLAATAVQGEQGIEDVPHGHLARASSAWLLLGRREQRCHDSPWLVRQIRGILLSRTGFLQQSRTCLC